MANTADALGEQETLDGLVAHSLEDFEDDKIKSIRSYCFARNYNMKKVNLPSVKQVKGDNAFMDCYYLKEAYLPNLRNMNNGIFNSCFSLKYLDISNLATINSNSSNSPFYSCYSLNTINLSNITSLQYYSLSSTGVGTFTLPACTNIGRYCFQSSRVSTIDCFKTVRIEENAFNKAFYLVNLILRSDTLCTLASASAFSETPIANGLGWIYVPSNLVDTYKTASNWSTYADQIVSLDEYPKALSGETITDSWDEIFQAESDGSYKTKYSVGDTKYLVIGGTYVLMQIIAFDRDILSSDHTSTAKITWLTKSLPFKFPINFGTNIIYDWAECECRKFLNDIIYEQIPENIRNKIMLVDKTYRHTVQYPTYTADETSTISEKVWIPSMREIMGGNNYEDSGVDYADFFTEESKRLKYGSLASINPLLWYSRSNKLRSFYGISSNGGVATPISTASYYGVALGFCT